MNILIVDDEDNIREILKDILEDENHKVFEAQDGIKGLEYFEKEKIDICFLDVWMPNIGGIDVLKKIKEQYNNVEVIMISGHAKIDQAVRATRLGAYDFLEKPLTIDKIVGIVKTIENNKKNVIKISKTTENLFDEMVGDSLQMVSLKELIGSAAKSDARILILGENGTGKELVAERYTTSH